MSLAKIKLPIKPLDAAIVLIALALTGLSAFTAYAKPRNTTQVLIEGSGRRWVYPLDADETVEVPGPLGNTIVRIQDKQAWVVSSPCDNKVCIAAGHVHTRGDWVACLPNNVFLMIEGSDDIKALTDGGAW
ncbi:MAG: NusG domain II-containing protein [Treponema sp.]|jgi:hypothetical protein|nr:NusG domain II-containing protein [Treponema sp.]